MHNDELRDLNSLPSIIRIIKSRRMRWAGHLARMREKRNVYMLLVGKPDGKRPLGRPRHRRMANIKVDLVEIGQGGVDWIGLAQDMENWKGLVNEIMKVQVHKMLGNSRVATRLAGSRVVLSSRELVS
jgi:transcription termination factor 2